MNGNSENPVGYRIQGSMADEDDETEKSMNNHGK
jgi:hypothetical protein